MIKKNDKWHEEVLINWQGLTIEEATWKHYTDMERQYLNFNLEDKVIFNEGGNDNRKGGQVGPNEN